MREFLKQHGFTTVEVEDTGVLYDVDNLKEYERVKKYYEKQYITQ